MSDWKAYLKKDPTDWLLEEDNPSVRYFTLKYILHKTEKDSEVIEAKRAIMEKGVVPQILARQKKEGYWEKKEDFYLRTKYKGTVWQLIILAELGADRNDERIKKTCQFVLKYSQDRESGGFSYRGTEKGGGFHSAVTPCLTGNMVWGLIKFGYLYEARVQKGIKWITRYQRFDDGVDSFPKGWPYEKYEKCWGKHTCNSGVVKNLKALAEILVNQRNDEVKNLIKKGAEFLLIHYLFKRSHNLNQVAKLKWLKLGFPTMWDTDALEMLLILTKLGFQDKRLQEAVNLILSKQDKQGRWILEHTYNSRFQVNIEQKNKPSKWVTLQALRALQGYYD